MNGVWSAKTSAEDVVVGLATAFRCQLCLKIGLAILTQVKLQDHAEDIALPPIIGEMTAHILNKGFEWYASRTLHTLKFGKVDGGD